MQSQEKLDYCSYLKPATLVAEDFSHDLAYRLGIYQFMSPSPHLQLC